VIGINVANKPKTGPITPSASSVQNKLNQRKANLLFAEETKVTKDRVYPNFRKDASSIKNLSPAPTPKINVPLNSLQNSIQVNLSSPDNITTSSSTAFAKVAQKK